MVEETTSRVSVGEASRGVWGTVARGAEVFFPGSEKQFLQVGMRRSGWSSWGLRRHPDSDTQAHFADPGRSPQDV